MKALLQVIVGLHDGIACTAVTDLETDDFFA